MPLPPALVARLAKRGILKDDAVSRQQVEEVIAENYDDDKGSAPFFEGMIVTACPNRWNPYHTCSSTCMKTWGNGLLESKEMKERRLFMLKKYPLPDDWEEVFDPNHGRYYYWNTANDKVSWLSPNHPRAKVTISVTKLFQDAIQKSKMFMENPENFNKKKDKPAREEIIDKNSKGKDLSFKSYRPSSKPNSKKHHDLDPMDPSAYSDVPRGSWSSGLLAGEDAITGVDDSVSGPLFQMRPYPTPGAILKAKQDSKLKKVKKGNVGGTGKDENKKKSHKKPIK